MLHEDQLIGPLDKLLFAAAADKGSLEPIHQVGWGLEASTENDIQTPFPLIGYSTKWRTLQVS